MRFALAALVLALGAVASGCAAPRVTCVESTEGGMAPLERVDWPRPTRLGSVTAPPRFAELDRLVLQRVSTAVDHVVPGARGARGEPSVDHVLALDWHIESDASPLNFLICFPGFVVFMPAWVPMRWEYDLTVDARLLRPGDQATLGERRRTARFEVTYTPGGYHVACGLGWGAIIFPPMVGAPLIGGLVGALAPWDVDRFLRAFVRSDAGRELAHGVAADVLRLLDQDLGRAAEARQAHAGKK